MLSFLISLGWETLRLSAHRGYIHNGAFLSPHKHIAQREWGEVRERVCVKIISWCWFWIFMYIKCILNNFHDDIRWRKKAFLQSNMFSNLMQIILLRNLILETEIDTLSSQLVQAMFKEWKLWKLYEKVLRLRWRCCKDWVSHYDTPKRIL